MMWAASRNNTWHRVDRSQKVLWANCRLYALDRPIKLHYPIAEEPPKGARICKQCAASSTNG